MPPTTLAAISQTGESLTFFPLSPTSTSNPNQPTHHLPNLIPEPHELTHDPKRNILYLTHAYAHGWYGAHGEDGHAISVIDCGRKEVVDVIDISPAKGPHYALLDEGRDVLWACVEGGLEGEKAHAGGIIGIDLATRKVIASIASGYKSHWFVATPDFRKAYTCNKDGGYISVIDLVGAKLVKQIPAPGGNEQPSISKDGRFAFFPTPTLTVGMREGYAGGFGISVVDTASDEIVRTIGTGWQVLTTHTTASGLLLAGLIMGRDAESDGLAILSADAGEGYKELGRVVVGRGPLTVVSDEEGRRAYVANAMAGTVTVVDLERFEVVRTIEVDVTKKEGKSMHVGAHGMALLD